jgi:small subunit ribosomal protein S15
MAIQQKQEIINNFKIHDQDTGSTHVQVALLTDRIKELTEHCKTHPKDASSRRGLIILVSKRKRLLKYLHKHNFAEYTRVIQTLGLKK